MMLVYNLPATEAIYQRFGGIDGSAYFIGGFGMTALTANNIVVVPIRSGVGLRLGANIGYLKFTPKATWNPFSPARYQGARSRQAPASVSSGIGPVQQGQQQQLRAGALRPHGDARALADHVVDRAELARIAGRQQEALLAPAEGDHHRVLRVAAAGHRRDIGVGAGILQRMQVHGGGDRLASAEARKPCFAADRQRGEAAAAFAQGPFQQRIVAAADDRHRLGALQPGRTRHARGQPVIELGLGKQPAAGDLGARHRALGHHLIDLAFLEAEIAGGFGGR